MHSLNASIFFPRLLSLPSLTPSSRRRLLEYKAWMDIAMYVSRGSAALLPDEITSYTPKHPSDWKEVFARVNRLDNDDGHAAKLVRALANGKEVSKEYEGKDGFVVTGQMWDLMGHMAIDSVEAEGANWVRNAGFEEAWRDIPVREGARL